MDEHKGRLRASELEDSGDLGVNPTHNLTMGEIIASRFSRRDLLRGSLAVAAISATVGTRALAANEQPARMAAGASFDFKEIEAGIDQTHHVAEGYDAKVLLRWGDPLFPDAPEFEPAGQTPERQARQFGYNTDFVGYVPIDGSGLSRYNYVTAETMVTVLEHMYRDPRHRDALLATLPIAGRDGTMATRLRKTRAEGNAAAKTGSIANVRALSGFVKTRDGEMLVFSILANDFVIPSATITWIADVAVETLANFSRN